MSLYSESDFVRAANTAYDLAGIVTSYLKLFRQYLNGTDNIDIPEDAFAVTFTPSKREGCISTDIWWTSHYSVQVPTFYDVDDDMYNDAWGSSNVSGYTVEHESKNRRLKIDIPISHLMRTEAQMKADFIARKAKLAADTAEAIRVARIAELKRELDKLGGLSKVS